MVVKSCYLVRTIFDEEKVKEFTEELNCTIRHRFVPMEGFIVYTIEDATGNKSVLAVIPEQYKTTLKGYCGLRIVVDNIQEAIEAFKSKGYEVAFGPIETESNIICRMQKDDEYRLVFEHKKNHK